MTNDVIVLMTILSFKPNYIDHCATGFVFYDKRSVREEERCTALHIAFILVISNLNLKTFELYYSNIYLHKWKTWSWMNIIIGLTWHMACQNSSVRKGDCWICIRFRFGIGLEPCTLTPQNSVICMASPAVMPNNRKIINKALPINM